MICLEQTREGPDEISDSFRFEVHCGGLSSFPEYLYLLLGRYKTEGWLRENKEA